MLILSFSSVRLFHKFFVNSSYDFSKIGPKFIDFNNQQNVKALTTS